MNNWFIKNWNNFLFSFMVIMAASVFIPIVNLMMLSELAPITDSNFEIFAFCLVMFGITEILGGFVILYEAIDNGVQSNTDGAIHNDLTTLIFASFLGAIQIMNIIISPLVFMRFLQESSFGLIFAALLSGVYICCIAFCLMPCIWVNRIVFHDLFAVIKNRMCHDNDGADDESGSDAPKEDTTDYSETIVL